MDNFDDVDDDDNEKHSKIQRDSRSFLKKAMFLMAALTVFALGLGYFHTHQPPQLAIDINKMIAVQQTTPAKPVEEVDLELAAKVDVLDQKVRARKKTGVIMETDEQGLELTKKLQETTLKLLEHRYGANTRHSKFRVVVDVLYPHSIIKDPDSESNKGHFTIEMAPVDIIPCSVFYFMEIVRTYKGGEFHRNAGHVLQAAAQSGATAGHKSMPFQEYSPKHPHAKYTTGYAGRPSGPGWYISIQDNTNNHGPGTQQKKNPYEADSNFGRIVDGIESGVIAKIHSVPEKEWLSKENCIKIVKMTIMVNSLDQQDQWMEWKMPTSTA